MPLTIWVLLGASLLPAMLFGQEKEKKFEPCSLLTAADAATIMGSPMSLVDRGKNNCTYGVLGKGMTTAVGRGREVIRDVTFGMKKYKNAEARDKGWASNTKRVHDPENKENTQVLSGIGDEAYLVNYSKDGKMAGGLSLLFTCAREWLLFRYLFSMGTRLLRAKGLLRLQRRLLISCREEWRSPFAEFSARCSNSP